MYDVAAVTPPIARDQPEDPAGGCSPPHELEHDRRDDERAERVREQAGPRAAETKREQRHAGHYRDSERAEECLPE